MDEKDRDIINYLQHGFPVCASPYRQVAGELGISEEELLERLKTLLDRRELTRFGPMYNAERIGGALTLAAVKAPLEDFEHIADRINAFPEVAHNYQRDHEFNIWFVVACEKPGRLVEVLREIECTTGLEVMNLPKLKEYFVELKLAV